MHAVITNLYAVTKVKIRSDKLVKCALIRSTLCHLLLANDWVKRPMLCVDTRLQICIYINTEKTLITKKSAL